MKNERGLTLIELLAVIVIIAIIMAIAIPAFMQIINNSKADTHLANAREVLASGRIAHVSGFLPKQEFFGAQNYTVQELLDEGFLTGQIKNPSILPWENTKNVYDLDESIVVVDTRFGGTIFKVNLSMGGENFIFDDPLTLSEIKRDALTEELRQKLNIK